jgi:invasion protein IalB
MSFRKCLAFGVVAALILSAFVPGAIGAGAKPAPKSTVNSPAGGTTPTSATAGLPQDKMTADRPAEQNWLKVCDVIPAGKKAAGQNSCILRQVIIANQQLLPYGLSWQIDGQTPVKVPFMLCDKQSCASQLVINDQYIAALKSGHSLSLTAKSRSKDLVVTISLAGFGPVYDGKAAVTSEELNRDTTGGAALQLLLQDRAQQIRQQLDSAAPPSK